MFCIAVSISSHRRSSRVAVAAITDAVSSIPWMQLAVLHVQFSSSIGSTVSWPTIRWDGEHLLERLIVILSAKATSAGCSMHISSSLLEQAVSLDCASAISLCPHLITPLLAAWYAVTVIIRIL